MVLINAESFGSDLAGLLFFKLVILIPSQKQAITSFTVDISFFVF